MGTILKTISNEWDYTKIAKYYSARPNYAPAAIENLCSYIQARKSEDYSAADIGAGTANLTIMLSKFISNILAVEPNQAMREIGMERTSAVSGVRWIEATGECTTLPDRSVNVVTFGSSFSTMDRGNALKESHRILKDDGYFVCMWNNRDLTIPSQLKVEEIIRSHVPDYSHGARREQQANVILESMLFNHIYYFEEPQTVKMSIPQYIDGWRSIRNRFWDPATKEGQELLASIIKDIEAEFSGIDSLELIYITKVWIAKKQTLPKI